MDSNFLQLTAQLILNQPSLVLFYDFWCALCRVDFREEHLYLDAVIAGMGRGRRPGNKSRGLNIIVKQEILFLFCWCLFSVKLNFPVLAF